MSDAATPNADDEAIARELGLRRPALRSSFTRELGARLEARGSRTARPRPAELWTWVLLLSAAGVLVLLVALLMA